MFINLTLLNCRFYQKRDDEHCSQRRGYSHPMLSKVCEIARISPSDTINQNMHVETLEHSGDLMPRFARYNRAKGTVLKSAVCWKIGL
jgi:hypothetical protein